MLPVTTKHTSPLLDRLVVVWWVQSGVDAAVVDLETGTRAAVAGIHVLDDAGPVGWRGVDLALCAGRVPGVGCAGRGHEAAGWNARVGGCGCEEFGIGCCHDVGHHCAGGGAGYVDARAVALVFGECVGYHVGDGVAVAAAVVGQGGLGGDVPAGAAVGRRWVDDDEAVLVGEFIVWGLVGVAWSGTLAVVDCDNDWRLGGELRWDVDVHLGLERVSISMNLGVVDDLRWLGWCQSW